MKLYMAGTVQAAGTAAVACVYRSLSLNPLLRAYPVSIVCTGDSVLQAARNIWDRTPESEKYRMTDQLNIFSYTWGLAIDRSRKDLFIIIFSTDASLPSI